MTVTKGGRTIGVFPGVDPRERLQVARDRARADAGGRLGPGVDHLEPGVAHEPREERADVGMAGVGHGQRRSRDPPGRRDGLLGDDPPAGADRVCHHAHDGDGLEHVEQQETAEREVDLLGQRQILTGLRECDHLRVRGRGSCDLVAGERVAVDGVHTAVAADHLGQGHRHVAPASADVDAAPAGAETQPLERRGQWAAVDVITQPCELTHDEFPHRPAPWPRTLRRPRGLAAPGGRWSVRPIGAVTARRTPA